MLATRLDVGAQAAKSSVRALRKAAGKAFYSGRHRAEEVVDASEQRALDSLNAAEKILLGVVDEIVQRGRTYARAGRGQVYASEARLYPRRRRSPISPAVLGVGAGLLISLLLRTPAARD